MGLETMAWIVGVVSVVFVSVVAVYFVGLLLSPKTTASVSGRIEAEPQQVWDYVINTSAPGSSESPTRAHQATSEQGSTTSVRPPRDGQPGITVEKRIDAELLVVTFDDGRHPYVGTWTFELDQVHGGTLLTVTEHGEISDPFYRALSRVLFRDTSKLGEYVDNARRALSPSAD